jgi:hypothetical protein
VCERATHRRVPTGRVGAHARAIFPRGEAVGVVGETDRGERSLVCADGEYVDRIEYGHLSTG